MSDEGKLFVGGLSFDTNEDTLAEAFSMFGAIEKVDIIRDTDTGKSRGFGFVKFKNVDDARHAQEAMHGKSLDGRSIRVDEAGEGGSIGVDEEEKGRSIDVDEAGEGDGGRGGFGSRGGVRGRGYGGRGGGYKSDREYDVNLYGGARGQEKRGGH